MFHFKCCVAHKWRRVFTSNAAITKHEENKWVDGSFRFDGHVAQTGVNTVPDVVGVPRRHVDGDEALGASEVIQVGPGALLPQLRSFLSNKRVICILCDVTTCRNYFLGSYISCWVIILHICTCIRPASASSFFPSFDIVSGVLGSVGSFFIATTLSDGIERLSAKLMGN